LRYFIDIAYKGTAYHGWQIQPNANTVQAEVNKALSILLKQHTETLGSGRTDTGVHALSQFVHFDSDLELNNRLIRSINAILPKDIVVKSLHLMTPEAHARFDAVSRAYIYKISTTKNPFQENQAWLYTHPLNLDAMNEAALLLLHHTDFQCFSKVHTEVLNFNCTITKARWYQEGEMIYFEITANRFLRGMVRAIVGTMVEVGRGLKTVADFQKVLDSQERSKAGMSASPDGLYLCDIRYPSHIFIKQL
jgi:tRNA pseudouridine38-40 synthase